MYKVIITVLSIRQNSGLKFRKFHVPSGTVHSGCIDLTQATARLVIVLVSRIQKSGTGDNNFVKWKGTFRLGSITSRCLAKWARTHPPDGRRWKSSLHFGPTDRNDQTGHSGPPSKVVPNIPVNRSIRCTNRNFWNFGLNGKRPKNSYNSAPLFPRRNDVIRRIYTLVPLWASSRK